MKYLEDLWDLTNFAIFILFLLLGMVFVLGRILFNKFHYEDQIGTGLINFYHSILGEPLTISLTLIFISYLIIKGIKNNKKQQR